VPTSSLKLMRRHLSSINLNGGDDAGVIFAKTMVPLSPGEKSNPLKGLIARPKVSLSNLDTERLKTSTPSSLSAETGGVSDNTSTGVAPIPPISTARKGARWWILHVVVIRCVF
jgi:hypothetical protein